MRRIKELISADGLSRAVIYRDTDWGQYVVRYYRKADVNSPSPATGWIYRSKADSFHDDKADAFDTANHVVNVQGVR